MNDDEWLGRRIEARTGPRPTSRLRLRVLGGVATALAEGKPRSRGAGDVLAAACWFLVAANLVLCAQTWEVAAPAGSSSAAWTDGMAKAELPELDPDELARHLRVSRVRGWAGSPTRYAAEMSRVRGLTTGGVR